MAQLGLAPPTSRPTSSYSYSNSNYNLPSSSNSGSSENDDDDDDSSPLPFPAALSRQDFLAPDFDAATYLSALHTGGPAARHQTLEDLRSELRDRSAAISAELLELVNANYTAFLGLGDELKGGEERVEDVRVALLGFRRAVEELQARVRERRVEVGRVNGELGAVKGAVELGRRMLELDERVAGLEGRLVVGSVGKGKRDMVGGVYEDDEWGDGLDSTGSDEEDESDEEEEGDEIEVGISSPSKLAALAREYVLVGRIADSVGRDLPFAKKIAERVARCRNAILLDLSTALREARKAGTKGQGRVIKYLEIYRILDAQAEAVKVLKQKHALH
ncbi:oligomeric golgi complex component, COG2-domain-containing protein [Chaetomidium leptoderma]|uniref:Conserved oligomeric Golgi complex subunit 2 n=1 Tax=Chaetomidium leptoderma TaxID=669021 RepID=A0AAN6ZT49_9PEZI|nr:oligomeric golgi complex component, COG2-domain-containing protein [Chaetomidium leptoderma]